MTRKIRVLVVDDSAMIRQVICAAFARRSDFEVVSAVSSAEAALDVLISAEVDVVTLDLEMPGMGGLALLEKYLCAMNVAVVVISSQVESCTSEALDALHLGAFDVISKPRGGAADLSRVMDSVIPCIESAAKAMGCDNRADEPATLQPPGTPAALSEPYRQLHADASGQADDWIIALGASTGGVQALTALLRELPADLPGVVIVQHMPEAFTGPFAKRIDNLCCMSVREARDGDRVTRGVALVAPGGTKHMQVIRRPDGLYIRLQPGPEVCYSRPSVDVLMSSVAEAAGERATGAILTGMGRDGAAGLLKMRSAGAVTFAQDRQTSTVYGMPQAAWECGAAEQQVPLHRMAACLTQSIGGSVRTSFQHLQSSRTRGSHEWAK